jgi:hypothetical protein
MPRESIPTVLNPEQLEALQQLFVNPDNLFFEDHYTNEEFLDLLETYATTGTLNYAERSRFTDLIYKLPEEYFTPFSTRLGLKKPLNMTSTAAILTSPIIIVSEEKPMIKTTEPTHVEGNKKNIIFTTLPQRSTPWAGFFNSVSNGLSKITKAMPGLKTAAKI